MNGPENCRTVEMRTMRGTETDLSPYEIIAARRVPGGDNCVYFSEK